jgi:hypothetical protein
MAVFKNPTVFILGAGASWHYGYPTGEELVKKVIQKAGIVRNYFKESADHSNVQRPDYIGRDALLLPGFYSMILTSFWLARFMETKGLGFISKKVFAIHTKLWNSISMHSKSNPCTV